MLLPSVTVVCSAFFPISDFAKSDEASNRGKTVDRLCQERALLPPEQWSEVPEKMRGFIDAFLEWRDLYRPKFYGDQCQRHFIAETLGYHGTPDLVATIGEFLTVIDLKSGVKPPYVDMQVAAYRRGVTETWREVQHGAWLVLKANGGSKYKLMTDTEDANGAADFFAALRVYRRINAKRLNNGNGG